MKGIILAGGSGTRLSPITNGVSKQILAIYDKPMIYYPLSVLMLAGIKDILIITTPSHQSMFKRLLLDGKQFGINLSYEVQSKPRGLADAFIIGEKFIQNDRVCLALGDNIFWGQGLSDLLTKAASNKKGATVFTYRVGNPKDFGILELDKKGAPKSIEEKPKKPKSSNAVTGLYFYDNSVISKAKRVKPSSRGEVEITNINNAYLKKKMLKVCHMDRGFAWLDTGNFDNMLIASSFVQTIEKRQGYKIACLEEIAFKKGWIGKKELKKAIIRHKNSQYGSYLKAVFHEKI